MTSNRLSHLSALVMAALLMSAAAARTQDTTATTQPADAAPQLPSQDELERRFAAALESVVFRGTFAMTGAEGLKGRAPLSMPRIERYAIERAEKREGDRWIITARVQFMEKDVRLPVPVRVVWAGDTPVITLDKMNLPMLGVYSARVVIHEGFYAGTWSGTSYGGVLSGQIIRAQDEEKIIELEKARDERQGSTTRPADGASRPASSDS